MLYGAMNFPIRPVLKELRDFSKLGFDYLELTMDPPQAHHTTILQNKEELLAGLDRYNMGIVCHLPTFVSTADLTDNIRATSLKEMLDSLEVAAQLNALKVVLHPSFIGGMGIFVKNQARQYALHSLEAIVALADVLGLVLCLENMFPRTNSLVNPEDFVEVFDRFPSLKMTLDTGHAHIKGRSGKKVLDFIDQFGDRIFHIHASDNLGKEDSHLPIGVGTVDFPEIVKAVREIGYNETVTFEIFSPDRDYLRISREKFATMLEQKDKGVVS
ncbi:MAG: sugar phosphate isomerase/epimerase [Desulfobacteraceae bacterium]|nr:sugar phosphate isomerase/epimerase [Desulfobacteraceae bacterium]